MYPAYGQKKRVLHVGPSAKGVLGVGFNTEEWQEVRLDVDPAVKPDIVADMCNMSAVQSESFDAIYTSHTIEHLYPDDVRRNLTEYLRVLKPTGFLVLACPDLEETAKLIVKEGLLGVAYESAQGSVTAIDILYGHRSYLSRSDKRDFMAHHTGFTMPILVSCLESVGFQSVIGHRRAHSYELQVYASKSKIPYEQLTREAGQHLCL